MAGRLGAETTTPDRVIWHDYVHSRLRDGRLLGLGDGRLLGFDKPLWRYYQAAPAPAGVTGRAGRAAAAFPLLNALQTLAGTSLVNHRGATPNSMREAHLLLTAKPSDFSPAGTAAERYLRSSLPPTTTLHRDCLLGVRLMRTVEPAPVKSHVEAIVESLTYGGPALRDYNRDTEYLDSRLKDLGFACPTGLDYLQGLGLAVPSDNPQVALHAHPHHVHVFTTAAAADAAQHAGLDACAEWGRWLPNHETLTFAVAVNLDMEGITLGSHAAAWLDEVFRAGARVVSIRGLVEPSTEVLNDARLDDPGPAKRVPTEPFTAAQVQQIGNDPYVQSHASAKTPTLVSASIVVGFADTDIDVTELSRQLPITLARLEYRQRSAMAEVMLCSPVRANPHLQFAPTELLAFAGGTFSEDATDTTPNDDGAFVGFTTTEHKASLIAPAARDRCPLFPVIGEDGTNRTLLRHLAYQWATSTKPVPVTHLARADHPHVGTALFRLGADHVDIAALPDGHLDPLSHALTAGNPSAAAIAAAALCVASAQFVDVADDLAYAMRYGIAKGATTTLGALAAAEQELRDGLPPGMVGQVREMVAKRPALRSVFAAPSLDDPTPGQQTSAATASTWRVFVNDVTNDDDRAALTWSAAAAAALRSSGSTVTLVVEDGLLTPGAVEQLPTILEVLASSDGRIILDTDEPERLNAAQAGRFVNDGILSPMRGMSAVMAASQLLDVTLDPEVAARATQRRSNPTLLALNSTAPAGAGESGDLDAGDGTSADEVTYRVRHTSKGVAVAVPIEIVVPPTFAQALDRPATDVPDPEEETP